MLSEYSSALISNGSIVKSVKEPKYRNEFWELYSTQKIDAIEPICKKIKLPLIVRCKITVRSIIKKVFGI